MLRFTPGKPSDEAAFNKPNALIPDCIEVKEFHPLFSAMTHVLNHEDPDAEVTAISIPRL